MSGLKKQYNGVESTVFILYIQESEKQKRKLYKRKKTEPTPGKTFFYIQTFVSFLPFRSFAEQNLHSSVLILAIPENGDPSYDMNEHSQGFKEGEELARSLNGRFMKMTSSFHMKSKYISAS